MKKKVLPHTVVQKHITMEMRKNNDEKRESDVLSLAQCEETLSIGAQPRLKTEWFLESKKVEEKYFFSITFSDPATQVEFPSLNE